MIDGARILVSGSRDLDIRSQVIPVSPSVAKRCKEAKDAFIAALEDAVAELGVSDEGLLPVVVVHGAAILGADYWADEWLRDAWMSKRFQRDRLHVERHPADWKTLGRKAGMVRNGVMVDTMDPSAPHRVIACWNGRSHGTKNLIDRATVKGLTIVRCWE